MDESLILGRYRLIERLASGGSAEVWRAHDEQLDRPVAVKRLHAHLMPDEASRRRLAAEARAVAGLAHPVVVGVYDVDATGEAPALVMELVEGESLSARIARDGPLAPRQAVAMTADLAEALYHAHQRGVIHRDVKPGNVLIGTDGRTRLVDFGIAHSLAASSERLTVTGTVIGTPSAMAPEQLAGGPITPRTDLYGLGVVLHESLTGRPPYGNVAPLALADAQRAGPPRLDGIDPALAAVIAACLAHDPAERPLHAGALAAALRDWLAGDPSAALAMAPVPPVEVDTAAITQVHPLPNPAAAAAPVPAAGERRPRRESRRWGAMPLALIGPFIGVGLVGAVLLSGIDWAGSGSPPDPTATATAVAATPAPTPPPWLAELVEKVEEECGADIAADVEAEMAAMTEEEASALADALKDECKGADEGGGGNGGGNGNEGGGNGNEGNQGGGNGRGNDD